MLIHLVTGVRNNPSLQASIITPSPSGEGVLFPRGLDLLFRGTPDPSHFSLRNLHNKSSSYTVSQTFAHAGTFKKVPLPTDRLLRLPYPPVGHCSLPPTLFVNSVLTSMKQPTTWVPVCCKKPPYVLGEDKISPCVRSALIRSHGCRRCHRRPPSSLT